MKTWAVTALAVGMLLSCGCAEDDPVAPADPRLEFTVSFEPAVLVLGESVTVTVTATNPTKDNVYIGTGSSSCALDALVEFEGGNHGMIGDRVCTADMSNRYVRAGETWTESWDWSGVIWQERGQVPLPAGTYPVSGTAHKYTGGPVTFEIRE